MVLLLSLICFTMINPSTTKTVSRNHYVGCHGIDMMIHKVNQYIPSNECLDTCEARGAKAVSVVGGRWCGCSKGNEMAPADSECTANCRFIPQHKCQCYEGSDEDYEDVVLSRAFEFIQGLPQPNSFAGYNCRDVPLIYYYSQLPHPAERRQEECFTMCSDLPRRFGSLLLGYKCGCPKSDDPDSDALLPVSRDCDDKMICMEVKTSVCLCGDVTVDPSSYDKEPNIGPLLHSDKFRCYFTKTTGKTAEKMRRPGFEEPLHISSRPEDCIHTCSTAHYKLAAVHAGGVCTCHREMPSGKFDDADCAEVCIADTLTNGCGGKYSASVYLTTDRKDVITVKELETLFQEAVAEIPASTDIPTPEPEGCFGIDLLVHKVSEYKPSSACWTRCKLSGTKKVAVAGGRWCGCPKNGPMGAADHGCFITCAFIQQPKCECFHGNGNSYEVTVKHLVGTFISELPSPHDFKGYTCPSIDVGHYKMIYPKRDSERAYDCVTGRCKEVNRNLGGYLMGYKCGCKRNNDPLDDSLLPVTEECVSRMICIEMDTSVCLCGNSKVDPLSYHPSSRAGPLLASDHFQCIKMEHRVHEARKLRRFEYEDIWKSPTTPQECIRTCSQTGYSYAGVSLGGACGCQEFVGTRQFTDEDCLMPCTVQGVTGGCGGPYTASVFAAEAKKGLTIDQMLELLENDIGVTIPYDAAIGEVIENRIPKTTKLPRKNVSTTTTGPPVKGQIKGTTEEELQALRKADNDKDRKNFAHLVVFGGVGIFLVVLAIMSLCVLLKKRSEVNDYMEAYEQIGKQKVEKFDAEDLSDEDDVIGPGPSDYGY